ncbi:MAG: glycosyltransferase family 2 protein [archaeon]|jgi:glycosyltransferase involved in cell wall biosynthesis|nr:glycosyltransferase family 2 protein [archaeon]
MWGIFGVFGVTSPPVSVVIPVYNGEKTLRKCLKSVSNQTYGNYSIIVVDNNSSDDSKAIIKEFQKQNSNLSYVFEPRPGRGTARNAGINSAKGSIIAMTDSDCVVPENWIEELVSPIVKGKESAVMGFEYSLIGSFWAGNVQQDESEWVQRNLEGKYINTIDSKNFAIKASLMKKLMFDPNLKRCIDLDLALRLKGISKVRFLPAVKVGHAHPGSLWKTFAVNFDKAYWHAKLNRKHKGRGMASGRLSEISSVGKIPLTISRKISETSGVPLRRKFFLLVRGVAWTTGLVWSRAKDFLP